MGLIGLARFVLGRAGEFRSLQAKNIGHGVKERNRSGCFCHGVFDLVTEL